MIAAGISRVLGTTHEVNIVEATIHQSNRDIAELVAVHLPEVVGISVYIWNATKIQEIMKHLRLLLPEAVFALGGPEASFNAGYWITQGADYVLDGEGEYTFPELLSALATETNTVTKPLDRNVEPVDPYSESYIKAVKGRIAYIESSRGCLFNCEFCLSAGDSVRFFPIGHVKKQINKLSKSGAKIIKFVDRTFNSDPDRAYELIEYIIELDADCRFHFEIAADLLDECMISLLGRAPPGRIQLEAGLQSFFKPALEAVSRRVNLEKAVRNIETLLINKNIHIHVDLIAGLPYETLDNFINSFNHAYQLRAHTLQLGFLKLLYGSELRKKAEAYRIRYCAQPPYEIHSSPWLSERDIKSLKQAENALAHTYNKCRFLLTLRYVLKASGLNPFSFFYALGKAHENHGEQLEVYAGQIFHFCAGLPGVDVSKLRDRMICDWLSMVKGNNMPIILKNHDSGLGAAVLAAERALGYKPSRGEVAVLSSGGFVYVDKNKRDPVTQLYKWNKIVL